VLDEVNSDTFHFIFDHHQELQFLPSFKELISSGKLRACLRTLKIELDYTHLMKEENLRIFAFFLSSLQCLMSLDLILEDKNDREEYWEKIASEEEKPMWSGADEEDS